MTRRGCRQRDTVHVQMCADAADAQRQMQLMHALISRSVSRATPPPSSPPPFNPTDLEFEMKVQSRGFAPLVTSPPIRGPQSRRRGDKPDCPTRPTVGVPITSDVTGNRCRFARFVLFLRIG